MPRLRLSVRTRSPALKKMTLSKVSFFLSTFFAITVILKTDKAHEILISRVPVLWDYYEKKMCLRLLGVWENAIYRSFAFPIFTPNKHRKTNIVKLFFYFFCNALFRSTSRKIIITNVFRITKLYKKEDAAATFATTTPNTHEKFVSSIFY